MATIRCVFIGASGVGKTTLLTRAAGRRHIVLPTIGVNNMLFCYKNIQYQCWDTSGAEKFKVLSKIFIRNTSQCVYMYDPSRPETFDENDIPHNALIIANVQNFNGILPENHTQVDVGDDESIRQFLDILRLCSGISPVEIHQPQDSSTTCCCWGT